MADFNNLFQRKEKSKEELARQRLSKETGNSVFFMGIIICSVVLMWTLLLLIIGKGAPIKITSGIISVLLVPVIVFLSSKYIKQKNAMSDILEAFLAGERNISNIVSLTGLNNKTAITIIQNMISKGIIIDANIDRLNNKLVDKVKTVASAENAGKTVLCTGCGAKNTLTGEFGQKCEYCGALLSEV